MVKGFQGKKKGSSEEKKAIKKAQRAKNKGTKKGQPRKTARKAFIFPKRKSTEKKRKSSTSNSRPRSNNMRKNSVKSILGSKTLQKVALGVGGGVMASLAIGAIAPQFSKFAAPAGAFALGGLEGVIGNFALGMLGNRTGGGTTAQNASPQMEVL